MQSENFTKIEQIRLLYSSHQYQPSIIWNVDESKANASKTGIERVFAQKGQGVCILWFLMKGNGLVS